MDLQEASHVAAQGHRMFYIAPGMAPPPNMIAVDSNAPLYANVPMNYQFVQPQPMVPNEYCHENNVCLPSSNGQFMWNLDARPFKASKEDFNKTTRPKARIDGLLAVFNNFFTEKVKQFILNETNAGACQASPVDMEELDAFTAILLKHSALQKPCDFDLLWASDPMVRMPFFEACMSKTRFEHIYSNLLPAESMKPMKELFETISRNCVDNFVPGEEFKLCQHRKLVQASADENNSPSFRVSLLVDVSTRYVCNLSVCTERLPPEANPKFHRVCNLLEPWFNTNRTLIIDQKFNSVALANYLSKKKIKLTGQIKPEDPNVPKDVIVSNMNPDKHYAMVCEQMILIRCPTVPPSLVLTTANIDHNNTEVLRFLASDSSLKINAPVFRQQYCCSSENGMSSRACWSLSAFEYLLDICAHNAYVLYESSKPGDGHLTDRSYLEFLFQLSDALAARSIESRCNDLNSDLSDSVRKILAPKKKKDNKTANSVQKSAKPCKKLRFALDQAPSSPPTQIHTNVGAKTSPERPVKPGNKPAKLRSVRAAKIDTDAKTVRSEVARDPSYSPPASLAAPAPIQRRTRHGPKLGACNFCLVSTPYECRSCSNWVCLAHKSTNEKRLCISCSLAPKRKR